MCTSAQPSSAEGGAWESIRPQTRWIHTIQGAQAQHGSKRSEVSAIAWFIIVECEDRDDAYFLYKLFLLLPSF